MGAVKDILLSWQLNYPYFVHLLNFQKKMSWKRPQVISESSNQ